jgi:hypothetical protein
LVGGNPEDGKALHSDLVAADLQVPRLTPFLPVGNPCPFSVRKHSFQQSPLQNTNFGSKDRKREVLDKQKPSGPVLCHMLTWA